MRRFVIFTSYSSCDDESWKRRIVGHLEGLSCVRLEIWSDSAITPGKKWKREVFGAIHRADMAILLVSSNFLMSEFINNEELPRLSERQRYAGLRLLPVIMENCSWQNNDYVNSTQVFPRHGRPPLMEASSHELELLLNDLKKLVCNDIPNAHKRFLCGQWLWLFALPFLFLFLWKMVVFVPRVSEQIFEGIAFICIPQGTFMMGSETPGAPEFERPLRQVDMDSYCIGKFEITVRQYESFRPQVWTRSRLDGDTPIANVSWHDANDFCEYYGFSLPTEAQWEYAARAGSTSRWSFGDSEELLGEYGWYSENSGRTSHDVGTREPSSWEIHDMHGNVWEWTADWYGRYPTHNERNPEGPAEGKRRVLRGGSYASIASHLRSANRSKELPRNRDEFTGFRCVRAIR